MAYVLKRGHALAAREAELKKAFPREIVCGACASTIGLVGGVHDQHIRNVTRRTTFESRGKNTVVVAVYTVDIKCSECSITTQFRYLVDEEPKEIIESKEKKVNEPVPEDPSKNEKDRMESEGGISHDEPTHEHGGEA